MAELDDDIFRLYLSRNIVDHQFPPLGTRGASSSSAHYDKERQGATFTESVFLPVTPLPLKKTPSTLWLEANENSDAMNWGSEKSIQTLVVMALKDVLRATGLAALSLQEDLTMFAVNSKQEKSDIYLVKQKTKTVGVIEVKKPTKGILDKPQVNSQIYDYMMALRSFSGLQHVFGIVTTYEQWRICWLTDTESAAKSTILPPPIPREFQLWPFLPGTPTWLATSELPVQRTVESPVQSARTFCATKPYPYNDPTLVHLLASVFRKMERSPVRIPSSFSDLLIGTGLMAKEDMFVWAKKSISEVVFGVELEKKDKEFWLLADLHGGADGNVWLASTKEGKGCVIKFSTRIGAEATRSCMQEALIWTEVWGRKAFAMKLGGYDAVAMPYVTPCVGTGGEFTPTPAVVLATKEAIAKFAENGKRHDDLKWSHVGKYFTPSGIEKVVLFDLAQVSENVGTEEAKRSMEESLGL